MARMLKNETKTFSLMHLEAGIERLSSLAQFASRVDARLVEIAARGFVNARRWTSDTTVTNQANTARNAAELIRVTESTAIQTKLTRALCAYGHALRAYANCQYNGSNLYVETSLDLLRS